MKKSSRFCVSGTGVLSFLIMVCILGMSACAWAGNNAGAAFSVWPDTGQKKCYDNDDEIPCPAPGEPFYGQDAQFQGPLRSYTKLAANGVELPDSANLADGWIMTRDNVTGLIWEIKTDDGFIHDKDFRYTWCDTNPDTNGGNQGTCGSGTDTEDFLNALNSTSFGGYSDWRLPTVKELSSLVNSNKPSPGPCINTAYFPNTVSSYHWSSTTSASYDDKAWYVDFRLGDIYHDYKKSNSHYVRAVRGGQAVPKEHFVDNNDGTITDTVTGLMWQKCSMGQTWNPGTNGCFDSPMGYSWQNALQACQDSGFAGYDDWRLPDRNELQSIIDYKVYNPSINSTYFSNTMSSGYWSSTTHASYSDSACLVWFDDGSFEYDEIKSRGSYFVRAVRSGQSVLLGDVDHDGDVDGYDLGSMIDVLASGGYDPAFDLKHDGYVDEKDVEVMAERFGR